MFRDALIIFFCVLIFSGFALYEELSGNVLLSIPNNIQYKTAEPAYIFGLDNYYLVDEDGVHHSVSYATFNNTTVPRR